MLWQSAVDAIMERMDEYFISREDWDTIVELGVDQNKDDIVLKKIPTATKSAFTRKYVTNNVVCWCLPDPVWTGTIQETILSRSTRQQIWERCRRPCLRRGHFQTSKRRWM